MIPVPKKTALMGELFCGDYAFQRIVLFRGLATHQIGCHGDGGIIVCCSKGGDKDKLIIVEVCADD